MKTKIVSFVVKCPSVKPGQHIQRRTIQVPVKVTKRGTELLTVEAMDLIEGHKMQMLMKRLLDAVRELYRK